MLVTSLGVKRPMSGTLEHLANGVQQNFFDGSRWAVLADYLEEICDNKASIFRLLANAMLSNARLYENVEPWNQTWVLAIHPTNETGVLYFDRLKPLQSREVKHYINKLFSPYRLTGYANCEHYLQRGFFRIVQRS
jgi:hypothetical protein